MLDNLLGTHVIELELRIKEKPQCLVAFQEFLREAFAFYEQPGGIRVCLLEDYTDPTCFIELLEYADHDRYAISKTKGRLRKTPNCGAALSTGGPCSSILPKWRFTDGHYELPPH